MTNPPAIFRHPRHDDLNVLLGIVSGEYIPYYRKVRWGSDRCDLYLEYYNRLGKLVIELGNYRMQVVGDIYETICTETRYHFLWGNIPHQEITKNNEIVWINSRVTLAQQRPSAINTRLVDITNSVFTSMGYHDAVLGEEDVLKKLVDDGIVTAYYRLEIGLLISSQDAAMVKLYLS